MRQVIVCGILLLLLALLSHSQANEQYDAKEVAEHSLVDDETEVADDQMTKMKQNPLDWNRRRRRRTRRRRCCNWFKRRRICITQWGASPCTAGQKE